MLDDVAGDAAVSGERVDAKPVAPIEGDQIAIHFDPHWKGLTAEEARDIGSLFHSVHKISGLAKIAKCSSGHPANFETHQRYKEDARPSEGNAIAAPGIK